MMLFYGIGHSLLIVAVGTSAGAARHILGSTKLHTANLVVKRAAGALLGAVGIYIAVGAPVSLTGICVLSRGDPTIVRREWGGTPLFQNSRGAFADKSFHQPLYAHQQRWPPLPPTA